jgi:hypothetical protein
LYKKITTQYALPYIVIWIRVIHKKAMLLKIIFILAKPHVEQRQKLIKTSKKQQQTQYNSPSFLPLGVTILKALEFELGLPSRRLSPAAEEGADLGAAAGLGDLLPFGELPGLLWR